MYLRDCHVVVFIQCSTHALCTASQRRAVLGDLFRVIDPRYELINMAEHVLKSSDGRLTTVMYNVYNSYDGIGQLRRSHRNKQLRSIY